MVAQLRDGAHGSGGACQCGNFVLAGRGLFARAALAATLAASATTSFTPLATLATWQTVLTLLGGGAFSAGLYGGNGTVHAGAAVRFPALALAAFAAVTTALARSAVGPALAAPPPASVA